MQLQNETPYYCLHNLPNQCVYLFLEINVKWCFLCSCITARQGSRSGAGRYSQTSRESSRKQGHFFKVELISFLVNELSGTYKGYAIR